MSVEFIIRTADLRRAMDQLKVNRGKRADSDLVDIVVSENAATFRAVGTETEEPVNGKQPGSVRVPLKTIDAINKVVGTFKKTELTFYCDPGIIKIESWSVKHPDIELGRAPDQRLGLPIDVSVLDTLALSEIFTTGQIVEQGLRMRVQEALEARTSAVANTLTILQPFGVTERQLQGLIEAHVKDAASRLRKSLEAA